MGYTQRYAELNSVFNPDIKEVNIPGSGIKIINSRFTSDYSADGFFNKSDVSIRENISFSYPVFVPSDRESKKIILLLHGLNERSWNKYLPWAYNLTENTGSYVVLFPISFHINRSPSSWSDPRAMMSVLKDRILPREDISMSSFANIALSRRLTEDPKRFLNSGYQTVCDIESLLTSIHNGNHEIIPQGCRVNIFSYSIGAFLAEILMMGDSHGLFSDTKLFMFCGGSVFSSMNGTSKLIMDSQAYNKVYRYYMNDFENEFRNNEKFMDLILSGKIAMAFRSMIDLSRFRRFREKSISGMRDRIRSIGLTKDRVIPAHEIKKTLIATGDNVQIWDFPYQYTHENPFPFTRSSDSDLIDGSFERMICAASDFLI